MVARLWVVMASVADTVVESAWDKASATEQSPQSELATVLVWVTVVPSVDTTVRVLVSVICILCTLYGSSSITFLAHTINKNHLSPKNARPGQSISLLSVLFVMAGDH